MVVERIKCEKCGTEYYSETVEWSMWETGHEPATYRIKVCPHCLTVTIETDAPAVMYRPEIIEYKLVQEKVIQKGTED